MSRRPPVECAECGRVAPRTRRDGDGRVCMGCWARRRHPVCPDCGQTRPPWGRPPGTACGRCVVRAEAATVMAGYRNQVVAAAVVAAGGVDYAYASTAHRAQGGTWDVAVTVGLDGLYREAGYVVMSRGKAANWLVVTAPDLAEVDAELARHDSPIPLPGEEPGDLDDELVDALSTSRHKLLALAQDPAAPAVHHAATTTDLPALEARARRGAWAEHEATRIVGTDPERLRARLDRTTHTAHHVAPGQRVKAWDRRNIGTVMAVDDAAGAVEVQFVSPDGRTAQRTL